MDPDAIGEAAGNATMDSLSTSEDASMAMGGHRWVESAGTGARNDMNHDLREAQVDAYLEFMERALIQARLACYENDVDRVEALVDMLHNLPMFLRGSSAEWFKTWSSKDYYDLFVAPVRERYPNLSLNWDAIPHG